MRKSGGRGGGDVHLHEAELEQARALVRQEIARDVHDMVLTPLTSLINRFQQVRYETLTPGMVEAYLGAWEELAREALNALRATLAGLYSAHPHADLGLPEALRRYYAPQIRSSGVRLTIESRDWPANLPLPVWSNLYLLVREALLNVEKHARASEVTVLLTRDARSLRMIIADDGVGLSENFRHLTAPRKAGSGLGVYGMRERVRALGGRLSLSSSPGNGVRLEISIPSPRDEPARAPTLERPANETTTGVSEYMH